LALTSPTGGGRSVGIVRLRTKATEFSLVLQCGGLASREFVCDVMVGLLIIWLFVLCALSLAPVAVR
jgi:hypothetical protein